MARLAGAPRHRTCSRCRPAPRRRSRPWTPTAPARTRRATAPDRRRGRRRSPEAVRVLRLPRSLDPLAFEYAAFGRATVAFDLQPKETHFLGQRPGPFL